MLKAIALFFSLFSRTIVVADKALGIAETAVDVGVAHTDHWKNISMLELATKMTQAEKAAAASVN